LTYGKLPAQQIQLIAKFTKIVAQQQPGSLQEACVKLSGKTLPSTPSMSFATGHN
jgi:hypothetical protein